MSKYKVQWNYRSSLGGPYLKGDVIELDEKTAEAVNRDSPGVLKSVIEKRPTNRMVTEVEGRTLTPAPLPEGEGKEYPDDRIGGANDQGPITKDDFKAVKGE